MFTSAYEELNFYIFSFLQPKDLYKCFQVCKYFNELGNKEEVWKKLAQEIIDLKALNPNKSIKKQYKKIIVKIINNETLLVYSINGLKETFEKEKKFEAVIKTHGLMVPEYIACLLSHNPEVISESLTSESLSFNFLLASAIESRCPILLRLLLNTVSPKQLVPLEVLHLAIKNYSFKILEILLENCDKSSSTLQSLLTCALQTKNSKVVEILLNEGADATQGYPDSPLMSVLTNLTDDLVDVELVSLLLKHGADPAEIEKKTKIPLIIWAIMGFKKTTGRFLRQEIRIKILTLLLEAAKKGHQDIIDQKTFPHGQTALMLSIAYGALKVAEFLIQQGANLREKDKYGKSILNYAEKRDEIENNNNQLWVNLIKANMLEQKDEKMNCLIS